MNGFTGIARFAEGSTVWVKPTVSADVLNDDEAVVIEDLGTGYIVLQESELEFSGGLGWFVADVEVEALETVLEAIA